MFKKNYHYEFKQLSALDLQKLKKKVDIAYLKSIEHFNDWDKLFDLIQEEINGHNRGVPHKNNLKNFKPPKLTSFFSIFKKIFKFSWQNKTVLTFMLSWQN